MEKNKKRLGLRNLPLQTQLYIFIFFLLLITVITQVSYRSRLTGIITARTTESASQQMKRSTNQIETLVAQIKESAATLSRSEYVQELMISNSPVQNYQIYPQVMELVQSVKIGNPGIYSVLLINNGARVISDPLQDSDGLPEILTRDYGVRGADYTAGQFYDHVNGYTKSYYLYTAPIYHSMFNGGHGEKIGCVVLTIDMRVLNALVDVDEATPNAQFLLLDGKNNVIASRSGQGQGELFANVFWGESEHESTDMFYQGASGKNVAQMQLNDSTGWRIVSIIPTDELTGDLDRLALFGMIFTFLVAVLLLLAGHMTARNMTAPIRQITDFLEEISASGHLERRLPVTYTNESGMISRGVNMLLDKVDDMSRENAAQQAAIYDANIEEKRAQVLAMQSQINPHFLYNTLNCLSSIGLANDVKEVAVISSAMSDIFRYSIKGDAAVTVRQELDCIEKYLTIMEARYPGRFTFDIQVDESLMNKSILKMILQPLVENAMIHGLEPVDRAGVLCVTGKRASEDSIEFRVSDNGLGMSPAQLEELKAYIFQESGQSSAQENSLGLRNIYKRIYLHYGHTYGMDIESRENEGTCVILTLPLMDMLEAEKGDTPQDES